MRHRAPDSPGGQRCRRSARFVPQAVAPVPTFLSAERIVRAGSRTCVIAARIKNWLTRSSAPRPVGTSSARRGRAHQPPYLHQTNFATTSTRELRRSRCAPVARHDIVEVLLVCERQSGEVIHRIALAALGPVPDAARPVTVVQHMNDLQVAVDEHRCPWPQRPCSPPGLQQVSSALQRRRARAANLCFRSHLRRPL